MTIAGCADLRPRATIGRRLGAGDEYDQGETRWLRGVFDVRASGVLPSVQRAGDPDDRMAGPRRGSVSDVRSVRQSQHSEP